VACVVADALKEPSAFLGKFDLIVSNPPYITSEDMVDLPLSVKNYEPHLALHGGDDGLDFYRAIAENYKSALQPGGYLCFEFGMEQGDAVCEILESNGYTILERSRDYNDRERAVIAQWKED
jgi:release factor glutamine methyltransferase